MLTVAPLPVATFCLLIYSDAGSSHYRYTVGTICQNWDLPSLPDHP